MASKATAHETDSWVKEVLEKMTNKTLNIHHYLYFDQVSNVFHRDETFVPPLLDSSIVQFLEGKHEEGEDESAPTEVTNEVGPSIALRKSKKWAASLIPRGCQKKRQSEPVEEEVEYVINDYTPNMSKLINQAFELWQSIYYEILDEHIKGTHNGRLPVVVMIA